jgi:hypothetical protein
VFPRPFTLGDIQIKVGKCTRSGQPIGSVGPDLFSCGNNTAFGVASIQAEQITGKQRFLGSCQYELESESMSNPMKVVFGRYARERRILHFGSIWSAGCRWKIVLLS